MKAKELMIVLGVAIVLLVVIIAGVMMRKPKENANVNANNNVSAQVEPSVSEENVDVKLDGTKVNTSSKLKETKKVDSLEVSNITLTENGNMTQLLADVKNPTKQTLGDFGVTIVLVDKSGNELAKVAGYVDKVEAGKTVQLNSSITADVANAYDFKISK